MSENKSILEFKKVSTTKPKKQKNFGSDAFIYPNREKQGERLINKIEKMKSVFISDDLRGLDIEKVLVLEVIGNKLQDLKISSKKMGLEWLDELEDQIEIKKDSGILKKVSISENFFKTRKVFNYKDSSKKLFEILKDKKFIIDHNFDGYYWDVTKNPEDFKQFIPIELKNKEEEIITTLMERVKEVIVPKTSGKLYLFMSNKNGLEKILTNFKKCKEGKSLEYGLKQWDDIFQCISNIRYWDENDRLEENNILQILKEEVELKEGTNSNIHFELEFWYQKDKTKRRLNEESIKQDLKSKGGNEQDLKFYEKNEVNIHLAKINLPVFEVKEALNSRIIFNNAKVKFFRPTGQSFSRIKYENFIEVDERTKSFFQSKCNDKPAVIGILDGLPLENHEALKDRLIIDDPDFFAEKYPVVNRRHGTSMASLICNGDLEQFNKPLQRKVYVRPILKPTEPLNIEETPKNIFFEDIIEQSVRRIFEEVEGNKCRIRVINLSVCHKSRWFYKNITSGGKLLDWLSWKYKVLFCVSSGNFTDPIPAPNGQLSKKDLVKHTIEKIVEENRLRRLLMPSDSLNSITVGALHKDEVESYELKQRVDILPSETPLPSPISSLGPGFKNAVKPEILFPGGRQLYDKVSKWYKINEFSSPPGHQVATPGIKAELNKYSHSRGTSNANALATRNAGLIFEMLEENNFKIPRDNVAVVLKALLVHGARWGHYKKSLDSFAVLNKEDTAKCLGFGVPDVERVMSCTEKRVTILGFDKIEKNKVHNFEIPLPLALEGSEKKRNLIITLAWLTPINPFSPKYKIANLKFEPPQTKPLYLNRKEVSNFQVTKGTVQHEVFSAKKKIDSFINNNKIKIPVECKEQAIGLTNPIPYSLVVTLETEEDINIYTEIKEKIVEKTVVKV